jgi:putative phage-type endonuclease
MTDRRRNGIGGSDVAAILNMDPYRNVVDVWEEKVGLRQSGQDGTDKPWLDRGRKLEPVIADMFVERHPEYDLQRGIFRRSKQHPFMQGTPDRLILPALQAIEALAVPDSPEIGKGVLEIKHANLATFAKIKAEGLPSHWILQWQHYALITGCEWGYFAVLNSERWELKTIPMRANPTMQQALVKLEENFWTNHVQASVRPVIEVVQLPDMPELGVEEKIHQRDDQQWREAIFQYRYAKGMEADAKTAVDEARARLEKEVMGDEGYGVYEGAEARVYWRQQKGRTSFDKKALIAAKPVDRVSLLAEIHDQRHNADWIVHLENSLCHSTALDLDPKDFEKQGKPFETLRVFDLRREE